MVDYSPIGGAGSSLRSAPSRDSDSGVFFPSQPGSDRDAEGNGLRNPPHLRLLKKTTSETPKDLRRWEEEASRLAVPIIKYSQEVKYMHNTRKKDPERLRGALLMACIYIERALPFEFEGIDNVINDEGAKYAKSKLIRWKQGFEKSFNDSSEILKPSISIENLERNAVAKKITENPKYPSKVAQGEEKRVIASTKKNALRSAFECIEECGKEIICWARNIAIEKKKLYESIPSKKISHDINEFDLKDVDLINPVLFQEAIKLKRLHEKASVGFRVKETLLGMMGSDKMNNLKEFIQRITLLRIDILRLKETAGMGAEECRGIIHRLRKDRLKESGLHLYEVINLHFYLRAKKGLIDSFMLLFRELKSANFRNQALLDKEKNLSFHEEEEDPRASRWSELKSSATAFYCDLATTSKALEKWSEAAKDDGAVVAAKIRETLRKMKGWRSELPRLRRWELGEEEVDLIRRGLESIEGKMLECKVLVTVAGDKERGPVSNLLRQIDFQEEVSAINALLVGGRYFQGPPSFLDQKSLMQILDSTGTELELYFHRKSVASPAGRDKGGAGKDDPYASSDCDSAFSVSMDLPLRRSSATPSNV